VGTGGPAAAAVGVCDSCMSGDTCQQRAVAHVSLPRPRWSCAVVWSWSSTSLACTMCIDAGKFTTMGRRVTQVVMQGLGRTEASEDPEYDAAFKSLTDMKRQLVALSSHVQTFVQTVRSEC
jgi:hypothetical protein